MAEGRVLFPLLYRGKRRIICTLQCTDGFQQNHKEFQAAMRKFVREVVYPDAQAREEDGKPPSQSVLTAMAEMNIIGMRLGPGKHLEGRVLMGGIVKPEKVRFKATPDNGGLNFCSVRSIP